MCGRAFVEFGPGALTLLTATFGPQNWESVQAEIRPTDPLPFVKATAEGYAAAQGRWGLLPPGFDMQKIRKLATFNARVETLSEKPVFQQAFEQQRCVIPLTGYFEWPTIQGQKQKVRITRKDGKPLLAAGLWSQVETETGFLVSCTMVTRPPTPDMARIHHLLPAFLLTPDLPAWLSGSTTEARDTALTSWPPGILQALGIPPF